MGLRGIAEADLAGILEDDVNGFGYPITLTAPDLTSKTLKGFSSDIGLLIDPDTGLAISGRRATIALRISTLIAQGFTSLPAAIQDSTLKPWIVDFDDINGNPFKFKVQDAQPDRGLGIVTCTLEIYEDPS